MSKFSRIIDRQKYLLLLKGYDERILNIPEPRGAFVERLKCQFSDCVHESFWKNEMVRFSASMTGFFADQKEAVKFIFNFEYDPNELELWLKSLVGIYQSIPRIYSIKRNNPKDLPFADKVNEQLHDDHAKSILNAIFENDGILKSNGQGVTSIK